MIRIAIVDDKANNRAVIKDKLQRNNLFNLVLEATNGEDFLEKIKVINEAEKPHIVLMDLEMPQVDGVTAIATASSMHPEIKFVVLTIFDDDDKIFEAIKAGAHGYLLKDENAVTLHNAIITVAENGGAPMSPAIARKALSLLSRSELPELNRNPESDPFGSLLTEREREILQHTIAGYDAKRIASLLDISVFTIRKHIANIYQKLHVNSRAQIISLAHKNNWL